MHDSTAGRAIDRRFPLCETDNSANMSVKILVGDCLESLDYIPSNTVHTCVTSPPYFGLRSYMPDAVRLRDDLNEDERKAIEEELARLGVKPNFC